MYHFISGYTAKVAGTEVGVTEPKPNFSACFGAPFLVWHPHEVRRAVGGEDARSTTARAWLGEHRLERRGVRYGGKRMSLGYTRAIIDAIHDGTLLESPTETDAIFGLEVPVKCAGVPDEILLPRQAWADGEQYDDAAAKLAGLFVENFQKYEDPSEPKIAAAGPKAPPKIADVA